MTPRKPDHPQTEVHVDVEGRTLRLTNLEKVLYPSTGTTKGEVLDYYARVAPVLLPHLAGRPVTRIRWPHGVGDMSFFEKNAPAGTPSWVRTADVPTTGSRGRGATAATTSAARAARSWREATPSLRRSDETWLSTVRTEMPSFWAILAVVRWVPSASSTSASREETASGPTTPAWIASIR